MLKKVSVIILAILLIVFSVTGLMRLKFETLILEVLPNHLPEIQGLKDFQKHFSENQEVVVLLSSDEEEIEEEDAEALALYLRELWPDNHITYKSAFEENPELFAETVARIWSYAPAEDLQKLTDRLENPETLNQHLEGVKENLQNSFDQQQSTIASYDPLGFLQHPALLQLLENDASFESDDGKSRLLMIRNSSETPNGYAEDSAWLDEIRKGINQWKKDEDYAYDYQLTGSPVYNAEIGTSMEKDMSGTLTITSLCIGFIFLIIQRNLIQLVMISALLGLTFLLTLGIGGWVFGTLNLVSVGFAAILLGLVIDYAVVIIRESPHTTSGGNQKETARALRKLVKPSILWAALSTSIVFGVLTLSTFTGVQQLGGLIAIGLISGAIVMLTLAPIVLAKFPVKEAQQMKSPLFLPSRLAPWLPIIAFVVAIIAFSTKGLPKVDLNLKVLEPTNSEAVETFAILKKEFSAWSEQNAVIITSADSLPELHQNTHNATDILDRFKNKQTIHGYNWPMLLIPDEERYMQNHDPLLALEKKSSSILKTTGDAGFTEVGLKLSTQVFEAFSQLPKSSSHLTQQSANDPLVGAFFNTEEKGKYYFTGRMMLTETPTSETLPKFNELTEANVIVTGYTLMQAVLLPHVKKDFYVIFIPAAALLLAALLLVFRSWKDAVIAISVLLTSLLIINVVVVCTGQSWNFLSGMAIPLIVGAGIDYSIHLIFTLRRQNGDFTPVWNSVGKAICFCGLSTAIGFASLTFASNEALRSMGMLCSTGILVTMALSLLVIPGLWKWSHRRRLLGNSA